MLGHVIKKYCADMVKDVEASLEKKGLKFPSKCVTPLNHRYSPALDYTGELMADGVQQKQEMI